MRKIGYSIAGFLAGGAFAMQYAADTKVTTHYSDGHTTIHTESNPVNYIILAIKFFLLAAAVIIVAFVSTVIMLYSATTGLKRNYDWKKIIADAKAKKAQLQGKK